jgi:RimJ/RimL family protein N-acetyltransferase
MRVYVANKNDIIGLKKLDAKETVYVKELNEFHTILDNNEFLSFFLNTNSVFVAESDSVIVGYLIAQIRKWMFHYKKIIWIEHIFVDPERRREGVAQSMLNYMISHYAKDNPEIEFIFGKINSENKASLKLAEKASFKRQKNFLIFKKI